jgi:SAM-dependent methyltransferase
MSTQEPATTSLWDRLHRLVFPFRLSSAARDASLIVPDRFNRNSSTVSSLMTAEESGAWLLERMRQQIGLDTLATSRILDFGCGVRFTQAIVNKHLPVGSYVGIDCFDDMIDFLRANVSDTRFSYFFLDAHHPLYNPGGHRLSKGTPLPVPEGTFGIVSMFSVITHQDPHDAESIFTILRRYVSPRGHLFFTCFLDDAIPAFEDRSAEQNGGRCFYNPDFLSHLVESCGWRILRRTPPEAPLIGDSFVCSPDDAL